MFMSMFLFLPALSILLIPSSSRVPMTTPSLFLPLLASILSVPSALFVYIFDRNLLLFSVSRAACVCLFIFLLPCSLAQTRVVSMDFLPGWPAGKLPRAAGPLGFFPSARNLPG